MRSDLFQTNCHPILKPDGTDHQQSLRRGFNRSRRRVRRERDSATSTHIGGAIYTLGQCAARKSVRISGALRISSFTPTKTVGFLDALPAALPGIWCGGQGGRICARPAFLSLFIFNLTCAPRGVIVRLHSRVCGGTCK